MKRIVVSGLLLIVAGISIFWLSKRDEYKTDLIAKRTTDYTMENTTVLLDETSLVTVSETILEETSKDKKESNKEPETKDINSDNISISFFYAKDIRELTEWIKSADNNDPRKHFLNVVRQKKEILTVRAKDKKYKLQSISVHPDYEYMSYTFRKDQEYIDVVINLSDSMKQQMHDSTQGNSINKAVSEYNKELAHTYKDFRLKEGKAKILESKIHIFYNDGKYYKKLNGELRLIAPSVFFEYKGTEIKMNLYGKLKEERWDNKYLELFDFKIVQL